MIGIRAFAIGGAFGAAATWMVVGVLSVANAGEPGGSQAGLPNGDPCAGQELSLKIDGHALRSDEGEETPTVPYGPTTITGVLHCGTVPIREGQIAVTSVDSLQAEEAPIVSSVTSGLDGSFSFTVPPGPNRVLSFEYTSYSGDPGPSVTALATLQVRPWMKLRIGPRVVRNHHRIYWTATVLGPPFPPRGITLETQVQEGSHWQTFDEIVLKREGTGRIFVYRFARTFTPTIYTFRVALPATGSGDYPFAFGASNTVNVRVNP